MLFGSGSGLFWVVSQKQGNGKVGEPNTRPPAFQCPLQLYSNGDTFCLMSSMLNVRWYCRYSLSYRDLEEMMQERGIEVDHSTINRACVEVRCGVGPPNPPASETHQRFLAS